MGAYVNPPVGTKEQWLEQNGTRASANIKFRDIPANSMLVVVVDNGMFTAAGICFDEREFNDFTDESDDRPKRYFVVETEKLHTVSDELKDYMKKE
jgi:hypothetical protein